MEVDTRPAIALRVQLHQVAPPRQQPHQHQHQQVPVDLVAILRVQAPFAVLASSVFLRVIQLLFVLLLEMATCSIYALIFLNVYLVSIVSTMVSTLVVWPGVVLATTIALLVSHASRS